MSHSESDYEEQLTVADAGRKGGIETRNRHGSDFYRRIGTKGGMVTRERYSRMMSEFGRRGGRPRRPSLEEHQGEEGHMRKE